MAEFFGRISEAVTHHGVPVFVTDDALILLAALVRTTQPDTVAELAETLDWTPQRVAGAWGNAERQLAALTRLS